MTYSFQIPLVATRGILQTKPVKIGVDNNILRPNCTITLIWKVHYHLLYLLHSFSVFKINYWVSLYNLIVKIYKLENYEYDYFE